MENVTPEIVRELLKYDPETGSFEWRHRDLKWFKSVRAQRAWNGQFAGKKAATAVHSAGYNVCTLMNKVYYAHRLAFAHHHGYWPSKCIDHINGDRKDNRISNLRDVSHSLNMKNSKLPDNNTSGYPGVYWSSQNKHWIANIWIEGKFNYLGQHKTKEAAIAARKTAEEEHGFLTRL
ncbi:MAG: HNH endonuclease signature motif containing protein [Pseudomonadota bacterium]